jgi:putative transposase
LYLSWKDVKPFIKDLAGVYRAATKEAAERGLDTLAKNWGERYLKGLSYGAGNDRG